MPARNFSIAAASPKPLRVTLAPWAANALAMERPMPDVDPVTRPDFPFSMGKPQFNAAPAKAEKGWLQLLRGGRNVGCFLLRCNISIHPAVTFSRFWPTD